MYNTKAALKHDITMIWPPISSKYFLNVLFLRFQKKWYNKMLVSKESFVANTYLLTVTVYITISVIILSRSPRGRCFTTLRWLLVISVITKGFILVLTFRGCIGKIRYLLSIKMKTMLFYPLSIDDVTCDVMPGSMRTPHSNISCSFARQFELALYSGLGMSF